jgi:hypothetical protein
MVTAKATMFLSRLAATALERWDILFRETTLTLYKMIHRVIKN